MSFISDALGDVGKTASYLTGAGQKADAATAASHAQTAAAQQGIGQWQDAIKAFTDSLNPYAQSGLQALSAQSDLMGLNGNGAQGAAINNLQKSPLFTSAMQLGDQSILANASATGGLRGGNTQAALGQFAPQLLSQFIQQQLGGLGGLRSAGQSAAGGIGEANLQGASSIANLLGQQGAAKAGSLLAQGQASGDGIGTLFKVAGGLFGF
jgi:hypothetical protein